jgi:hypothetical protein
MTNRIMHVAVLDRLKDPTEPEVWVGVVPERPSPTLDIRGRLTGPSCRYASTVEVAYPLRPAPRPLEGLAGIVRRGVIPEASLWDPASPFLYRGQIELWDNDTLLDQVTLRHGLRSFHVGKQGFYINSRPLTLRGIVRTACPVAEMLELRHQGYNLLVGDLAASPRELWDDADEYGMLVLARVAPTVEAVQQAAAHPPHASNLGWVLHGAIFHEPALREAAAPLLARRGGELIGVDADSLQSWSAAAANFVLGPPLRHVAKMPRLALTDSPLPDIPGHLGTVRP